MFSVLNICSTSGISKKKRATLLLTRQATPTNCHLRLRLPGIYSYTM